MIRLYCYKTIGNFKKGNYYDGLIEKNSLFTSIVMINEKDSKGTRFFYSGGLSVFDDALWDYYTDYFFDEKASNRSLKIDGLLT